MPTASLTRCGSTERAASGPTAEKRSPLSHHLLRCLSEPESGLCRRRLAAPASPEVCPVAVGRARAPKHTHIPSLKRKGQGAHTLHCLRDYISGRAKTRTPAPLPALGLHHMLRYWKADLLKKSLPTSFNTFWIFFSHPLQWKGRVTTTGPPGKCHLLDF